MPDKKAATVKELMIDVFEYPHIPYWFTIKQVIGIIKKSLIDTDKCVHPRVVLVFDERYNLMGLLTLKEILRGLMPKQESAPLKDADRVFIDEGALTALEQSMFSGEAKKLLEKPVSEFMIPVTMFVSHEDSVLKAALLMLHHNLMVLPVLENNQKFIGVIRMTEVFEEIFDMLLQVE